MFLSTSCRDAQFLSEINERVKMRPGLSIEQPGKLKLARRELERVFFNSLTESGDRGVDSL